MEIHWVLKLIQDYKDNGCTGSQQGKMTHSSLCLFVLAEGLCVSIPTKPARCTTVCDPNCTADVVKRRWKSRPAATFHHAVRPGHWHNRQGDPWHRHPAVALKRLNVVSIGCVFQCDVFLLLRNPQLVSIITVFNTTGAETTTRAYLSDAWPPKIL